MPTTFLVPKNNAASTLNGAVDNVVTTWTVVDGSQFPSTFPFHLSCQSEIVECTGRTGNVLTVIRNVEGTSGAAHADGLAVELLITAQALSDLNTAVNAHEAILYKEAAAVRGPATTIAFVDGGAGADTITDTGNGLAIFATGDLIVVSGSASNDGTYAVVSAVAGTITLASGTLTAESAGASVTITRAARVRLDSGVAGGYMNLSPTIQQFGSGINIVQFLNATAVSFTNLLGTPIVKFSDTAFSTTPSVEFATGVLNVNEAISIDQYIDISEIAVPAYPAAGTRRLFNNLVLNDLSIVDVSGYIRSLEAGFIYTNWSASNWTTRDSWTNAVTGTGSVSWDSILQIRLRTGATNGSQARTYTGVGTFSPHSGTRIWALNLQNDAAGTITARTFRAYALHTTGAIPPVDNSVDCYIGWRIVDERLWAVHCAGGKTGTGIAFVDGGAGADTITDTGNGFGLFLTGHSIIVTGTTGGLNDGTYTVVSAVAGTITLATGSLPGGSQAAGPSVTIRVAEVATDTGIDITAAFAGAFLAIKGNNGTTATFYYAPAAQGVYQLVATHNTQMPAQFSKREYYDLVNSAAANKEMRIAQSAWRT